MGIAKELGLRVAAATLHILAEWLLTILTRIHICIVHPEVGTPGDEEDTGAR